MNIPAIIMMIGALSGAFVRFESMPVGKKVPDIATIQKKAIEYARIEPSEISQWKKRARYAALLPKLQVDYTQKLLNNVNVNINDQVYVGAAGVNVGPDTGNYTVNADNDQSFGVRAVWSFSDAIFSPDLLAVSEETRQLSRERLSILAEVNRNYYERERAVIAIEIMNSELKKAPFDSKLKGEIAAKKISFDEASAALDALTGGWFGEQVRKMAGSE